MAEKKLTYEELLSERNAYKAENDALKRDRVNRQAKNSVFLNLFARKEYQLALYKELLQAIGTTKEIQSISSELERLTDLSKELNEDIGMYIKLYGVESLNN